MSQYLEPQQPTVIVFTGAQTIAKAEEARKRLLDALTAKPTRLSIDCHDVEECDLTFVQILMAAKRSCKDGNCGLHLVGSPAVAAACASAGIDVANMVASKGD
jgi:anti-anti-sigma regulatory factor